MKAYIITVTASGDDYETDETCVDSAFQSFEAAKKQLKKLIKEERKSCGDEEYDDDAYDASYEITNFDSNYHKIIRIHEQEVK